MSAIKDLNNSIDRLLQGDGTREDYSNLFKVLLLSGEIRNYPELHGLFALRIDGSMVFTSGALEVKLSSAITQDTVSYVRRLFNILEGDFTFTVLRPGSTQGKWSRYNSNGDLLESGELGTFGTGQGADFDKTKLDSVIRHTQECGDVGILLSESGAYCCKSGTHIQLAGVDISTLPEYDPKTKAPVLAFVNAVSQRCGELGYTQMFVSNRNDQKAAGMRFTMVDGYIDTVNPTGERIVIDAGGGTYKVYHQKDTMRTHLGDIAYHQIELIDELKAMAA